MSHNEILRRDLVAEQANLGIYQFTINIEKICLLNLQPTYFCLSICILDGQKKSNEFQQRGQIFVFISFLFCLNKSYSVISIIFCNEWLWIFIIINSTYNPLNIIAKRVFSLQGQKFHLLLKENMSLNKVIIMMVYPIWSWDNSIMELPDSSWQTIKVIKTHFD